MTPIDKTNDIIDIKLLDEFQSMRVSMSNDIQYTNIYNMRRGWKEADDYSCEFEATKVVKEIICQEEKIIDSAMDLNTNDMSADSLEELKVPKLEVFSK